MKISKFNNVLKQLFIVYFLGISVLMINACDNKKNENGTVGVQPQACSSGMVQTQYGCLAQGSCPVGQAQLNNQCVQVNNISSCQAGTVSTQYGCLPQASCPVGQALYNNQCIMAYNNSNNCQGGFAPTQYGCLAQGSCPVGYALYNNQCIAASSSYYNNYNNFYNYTGYLTTPYYFNGYYFPYMPMYSSRCVYKSWYYYCY